MVLIHRARSAAQTMANPGRHIESSRWRAVATPCLDQSHKNKNQTCPLKGPSGFTSSDLILCLYLFSVSVFPSLSPRRH
jgi:hypothetical protein